MVQQVPTQWSPGQGPGPGDQGAEQIGGALAKISTNGTFIGQMLAAIVEAITNALPFSGTIGTFTFGAAAAATVLDANVKANSFIVAFPTNADAGTLMGSAKSLYISNRTAGVSFALSTASGVAASGTETFVYVILNIGT